MNTFIRTTAILAGLFLASSTFAQDQPSRSAPSKGQTASPRSSTGYQPLPIARMQEEMKLSEEQMGQLKEVDARAQKEKGAIDTKLSADDQRTKLGEIVARRNKEARKVLTPDQAKQWDAMMGRHQHPEKTEKAPQPGAQPHK